ncbi:MAG TPA: lytic murein transglycosylase [Solirubrobacteraceae bacterium]|nr:lytic murein transglycosylase [Solirubrobacteraceae bacterium]
MLKRRKLSIAVVIAASVVAVFGLSAIPSASADGCTVTITVAGGQQFTFQNVPPGTPPTSLPLPVTLPITNVAQSCPPVTATTPAATVTTSTQPQTTTSTSTSTSTSTTHKPKSSNSTTTTTQTTTTQTTTTSKGSGKSQGKGLSSTLQGLGSAGSNLKQPTPPKSKSKSKAKKSAPKPPPPVTPSGVPTPSNPTYSYSIPGPSPIGVPNFFIDSFQIPPFLLPIYQAAGSEYDVPWQILAAINEIETDYGRNLSVSSAGAVGWMQFIPSTWKRYAVDATGSGTADPYNPADAIFTAARYLHAAGASKNLQDAIYAYNHAWWYVQSVMLRAQLIEGVPSPFIDSLTDLVEGDFPVAAPAKYADDGVLKLAKTRVKGSNAAVTVQSDPNIKGTDIFANAGSPVVAANDGKIVKIGDSPQLGRYLVLQDATGNTYTYANLGSIPKLYPVPKTVKESSDQIAKALLAPSTPAPTGPASAGSQETPSVPSTAKASVPSTAKASKEAGSGAPSLPVTPAATTQPASTTSAPAATPTISAPMVKERLFADPSRPNSYAAGGKLQIAPSGGGPQSQISDFQQYFSDVLHLAKNQYTLEPLKVGSVVVAGTILGRLGQGTPSDASHLQFMIQPAGKDSPYIDPKPILDGWKLLQATAVYRAAGVNPFVGKNAKAPSVGQILLMSKLQLQNRVLEDPNVQIYPCGRRDIQDGAIDRRVLAVVEFLSASDLKPTVSGLKCGATRNASNGIDAAGATGESVDISAINGIPIQGHQGAGSITDITVRRLLTLQGAMEPDQIISLMSYKNQPVAVRMANHANRIQISFATAYGGGKKLSAEVSSILQPSQWTQLINHLSQMSEPIVPVAPSQYAIKTGS